MLVGERLGGRHQRGLEARLDGAQHRVQGDHGLARAHFPHQQPLHRPCGHQVGVDLLDRAPLIAGELEGQRPKPALDQLAGRAEGDAWPVDLATLPASRERRLVQEELLEREPVAGSLRAGHAAGK